MGWGGWVGIGVRVGVGCSGGVVVRRPRDLLGDLLNRSVAPMRAAADARYKTIICEGEAGAA